ncbi:hypothetical protein [uncultured Sphaerochaeta sp.]|uniref:tetratricopeptide repeat protein n=1 Tax=uncultured Sphaerochaeta sp. TaxID=886478 RepID=UPI0029C9BAC4|nr:hypothetical protein [uncultured Sphaerochaeta sp.]
MLFLTHTLAAVASLDDDYDFLGEHEPFVQFMDVVRGEGDTMQGEQIRDQMLLHPVLQEEKQTVLAIRSTTMLARLYTEIEKPDTKRAKELLKEAESSLKRLPDGSFFHLMGEAEIDSIYYLINPSRLAKGISSNSKIKKAYAQYPNQIYAILMKANSLLYAPSFAGGDKNEALSLFLTLLEAGPSQLNKWDLSSIYVGIGRICMDREEWDKALGYFSAAKAIYAFDPTLDGYIRETEESL